MTIFDERRCRVCGCTDEWACEGGCYWVEEDLCSTCAPVSLLDVLSLVELQVLGALSRRLKGDSEIVVTVGDIARQVHVSRGAANTALRLAAAAGVLRTLSHGSRGTRIQVLRPDHLAVLASVAERYSLSGVASG